MNRKVSCNNKSRKEEREPQLDEMLKVNYTGKYTHIVFIIYKYFT